MLRPHLAIQGRRERLARGREHHQHSVSARRFERLLGVEFWFELERDAHNLWGHGYGLARENRSRGSLRFPSVFRLLHTWYILFASSYSLWGACFSVKGMLQDYVGNGCG